MEPPTEDGRAMKGKKSLNVRQPFQFRVDEEGLSNDEGLWFS